MHKFICQFCDVESIQTDQPIETMGIGWQTITVEVKDKNTWDWTACPDCYEAFKRSVIIGFTILQALSALIKNEKIEP